MILSILGVGVGTWPEPAGGYDLWLPLFVVLAVPVIRYVGGLRITWRTALAALVGGTLWSWSKDALGVLPATAGVVLVAFAAGELVRQRHRRARRSG
jgi:hypothetical protein